jgi:hypothetical protein
MGVWRVRFRRPWTVDAVSPTEEHHVWFVVGWRASGAARRFIADRIAKTNTVPTDQELSAALRSLSHKGGRAGDMTPGPKPR